MKKLIILVIVVVGISSCNSYIGSCSKSGCGVWYPKKFTK